MQKSNEENETERKIDLKKKKSVARLMSQTNRNQFIPVKKSCFPEIVIRLKLPRKQTRKFKWLILLSLSFFLKFPIKIQLQVDWCCYFAQPFCGNFGKLNYAAPALSLVAEMQCSLLKPKAKRTYRIIPKDKFRN